MDLVLTALTDGQELTARPSTCAPVTTCDPFSPPGACISVACICFIFFLLLSEFLTFITVDLHSELFVHNPGDSERIPVRLDISLPNMGCEFVGLDIQDDLGD